jgi:bacillithiol biosynthesis cysteine-adding enzyme BshC
MKIEKLNFSEIPQLSAFDKAFQAEDPRLRDFLSELPEIKSFEKVIQTKAASYKYRGLLCDVLNKQYQGIKYSEKTAQNLSHLQKDNCFAITTAHQPSLLTGPLYFVYKIASAINLVNTLKQHYPSFNFAPIYYMGSEDHDFEELNHFYLFGKKLEWNDFQGGALGHYHPASLVDLIGELNEILGQSPNATELKDIIANSLKEAGNYQQFMFNFIHSLFDAFGLIVLLPDSSALKRVAIDLFKDDLLCNSSQRLLEETAADLKSVGFSNQSHARAINLFYLSAGKRERIEKTEITYKVLNSDLSFTEEEILNELHEHPERFSPNVILRPIYQELILPNLAYIGGGGELAYWTERKKQFEFYGVPFPILIRRNSVQWIDQNSSEKMRKLGLNNKDIFMDSETLIKSYILRNSSEDLNFNEEKIEFDLLFNKMSLKVKKTDASLEANLAAIQAQMNNSLEKLETKLLRSEKQKQESHINQIKKLQERLYLPDGLQERKENFMSLYLRHGKGFFDFLVKNLNPLEKEFILITEEAD